MSTDFSLNSKNLIQAYFGPLRPKNITARFFAQKSLKLTLRFYAAATSFKKLKKNHPQNLKNFNFGQFCTLFDQETLKKNFFFFFSKNSAVTF